MLGWDPRVAPNGQPHWWTRFDTLGPIGPPCKQIEEFGQDDGLKWVCGLTAVTRREVRTRLLACLETAQESRSPSKLFLVKLSLLLRRCKATAASSPSDRAMSGPSSGTSRSKRRASWTLLTVTVRERGALHSINTRRRLLISLPPRARPRRQRRLGRPSENHVPRDRARPPFPLLLHRRWHGTHHPLTPPTHSSTRTASPART